MRCICILMFTYVDSVNMSLSKLREMVKDRGAWHAAVHGITESDTTEQPDHKVYLCA